MVLIRNSHKAVSPASEPQTLLQVPGCSFCSETVTRKKKRNLFIPYNLKLFVMDLCLKLLALLYCVGVGLCRTLPLSNVMAQTLLRPRSTRNVRASNSRSTRFLHMRKTPPEEFSSGLHESWVLECQASGSPPPTIHWLRDGQLILQNVEDELLAENNAIPEDFTPIMGLGSTKSRLYLDCTEPQDEAQYTCVAETPYQRVSAETRVTIKADPTASLNSMCISAKKSLGTPARINMWSDTLLETIGNDAVLFCRTLGGPHPRTTWYFDDDRLDKNPKYLIQENGDLIIRNVEWADMGEYECVAENSLGRDTAMTFLYPVKREEEPSSEDNEMRS